MLTAFEYFAEFPNVDEFRRIGGKGVRKCLREFTDFEGPVCKGGLRAVPDVGKRPLPLCCAAAGLLQRRWQRRHLRGPEDLREVRDHSELAYRQLQRHFREPAPRQAAR